MKKIVPLITCEVPFCQYVSHCWTSVFDIHFYHCFVIFKNVLYPAKLIKISVRRDMINITQVKTVVLVWNLGLVLGVLV